MTGTRNLKIWLTICSFILLVVSAAAGDTHYVNPGDSIQAAIDAANVGDEIEVGPGTYYEAINFKGKAIRLYSRDGPGVTTIDAQLGYRVVECVSGEGSDTVLEGFTITGGYASQGAGMYNEGSSPTVTNCTFSRNGAYESGGGMRNESSSPTVTNCTFSENRAENGCGGGMHNLDGNPTVTNCTFSDNTARTSGAGMVNDYGSSPAVTNCTFIVNWANEGGGGMINKPGSNPTVTNCSFSRNWAESGGGIYNWSSEPTVTNCTFMANRAHESGGGMHNESSSPTVTDCTFSDNGAAFGGGILNDDYSSPKVTNCTFIGNLAYLYGGGMANKSSSPTVTNCTFSDNGAYLYGGGMHNESSRSMVTNCTFNDNTAIDSGGGMYNWWSEPTVTNCTFSRNSAESGGGMYNDNNSNPTVTNCILWDNQPPQIFGTAHITYSDVEGGWPGTYNIDLDPEFADADGRLSLGSPCIDTGNNSAILGVATDLDGNPRITDGNLDGVPVVDMGAYENMAVFVETCWAVNVGMTTATLCGRIIYDGGEACRYRFRYCREGDADCFTPWSSDFKVSGESFSQDVSGLTPGCKYYLFAQMRNSIGESAGGLKSFTTLGSLLQLEGPNGGETVLAGSSCLICWKADPTLGDRDVLIEYSTDNGSFWNSIDTVPNGDEWRSYIGGHYSWQAPAVTSDECLVRISDTSDPGILDVSDDTFSIVMQAVPDVVGLGQADAEAAITAAGLVVGTIVYNYNSAVAAGEVMGQYPAAGTPVAAGSAVDLVVSAGPFAAGPPAVETEDAVNIGASSATVRGVITDDGGGCCQYRFWYHEEEGDDYKATPWSSELKVSGESFSVDVSGLSPGRKYYFWAQVKNSAGESDRWGPSESFTTLEGLLQLVRPNGGTYRAGRRCLICWKADVAVSEVLVECSTDNGGSWSVIDTVLSGDEWRSCRGGHCSWQAPAVSSDECLVRISDTSDPGIFDVSSSTFSIVP